MCEDMICPECDGEGKVERFDPAGPYDVPCEHCFDSCGKVPKPRIKDDGNE